MFYLKAKQFLKNRILVLMTSVYFIWIGKRYIPLVLQKEHDIVSSLPGILGIIPVSFVFFLFLSYAFFSQEKSARMDEVIMISKLGKVKSSLAGLAVLVLIDFLLFLFLMIYLFRCCVGALNGLDAGVIIFGIRLYVCHIFLVNLFAILVGLVVSFLCSEMKSYVVLVAVSCFFSHFVLSSLYQLAGDNETIYHAMDLFGVTTRTYYAMADGDYIYSVENVEFQRVLFWNLLMVTIFLFQSLKGRRKILVTASGILTLLCLWFYLLPSGASNIDVESRHDAWNGEVTYYEEHKEQVGTYDNYLPKETFQITKYEADLKVRRVLQAEVSVYVDKGNLEEYIFALRHEFRVKEVTDEDGRKLAFTQDGDRLIVRPGDEDEHTFFSFYYEGASKIFYSTSQAVRLPAYFAYLPFSGERYLYFEWSEYNDYIGQEVHYYTGSAREGLGYEAEYDITVDSGLTVYSNLPEKEKNHFCGKSDGVTLMANPYLVKEEVEGASLIYSKVAYRYYPNTPFPIIEDWREFIRQNSLKDKTIFCMDIVPGSAREYSYFGKEYLVMCIPYTEEYQSFLKTGNVPYRDESIYGGEGNMDKALDSYRMLEGWEPSSEEEE